MQHLIALYHPACWANIVIATSDGKPVYAVEKTLNAGYNNIRLDLGTLAPGVYIIKLKTPMVCILAK